MGYHLRDEVDDLKDAGLAVDEAFLISVKRLGNADAIANEFAKINTASSPSLNLKNGRPIIFMYTSAGQH